MWFISAKLEKEINDAHLTREWLWGRLGRRFEAVANGEAAADYSLAREILRVFGYEATVAAIDWRRTPYAG